MTERMDPEENGGLIELSRKIEVAWRIITRPQGFSESEIEGAENYLECVRQDLLDSIGANAIGEQLELCESLMLGLHHYGGAVLPTGFWMDESLN